MHGLIFVTWEQYLAERFGSPLLKAYRETIGEKTATAPLASRVYDDATLLAGVGAACQLTKLPADTLLREYGRYFMLNGLTSHLCMYLLTQVHSGRELLLMMSKAHAQMHRTSDAITPPLFKYEALSDNPNELILIYDSPRQLCSVLFGAIEGAAERYEEKVEVVEQICMKQGGPACRFELHFSPPSSKVEQRTPEQESRWRAQQYLANFVWNVLPDYDGVTLSDLQMILQQQNVSPHQRRPSVLLEALHHLQHAGLVATTAGQQGDDLTRRRYWRVRTSDG